MARKMTTGHSCVPLFIFHLGRRVENRGEDSGHVVPWLTSSVLPESGQVLRWEGPPGGRAEQAEPLLSGMWSWRARGWLSHEVGSHL